VIWSKGESWQHFEDRRVAIYICVKSIETILLARKCPRPGYAGISDVFQPIKRLQSSCFWRFFV
jgi:hypothetical protein